MAFSFLELTEVILPIFLLLGLGAFLHLKKWVAQSVEDPLMRVVVFFFYPALIIRFVGFDPIVRDVSSLILAFSLGFLMILAGFFLAYFLARSLGMRVGSGQRTFAFTVGIFNFGYLPIPIVAALFGATDGTMALLLIFNMGVEMAIWSVGIILLEGKAGRDSIKRLFNPPLIALIFGLIFNLSGGAAMAPISAMRFLEMLGNCAIPLGLILSGCVMGRLMRWQVLREDWKCVFGGLMIRMAILPMLFLSLPFLFDLGPLLTRIVVIQAAMPTGVFSIVLTKIFGGSEAVALRTVVPTNMLALLTIPFWLSIGFFIHGV